MPVRPHLRGKFKRLSGFERNQWRGILASGIPDRASEHAGKRVLCATSVGGHAMAPEIDSLVAMASWLRGAEADFLLCDGLLPACEACVFVNFNDPNDFVRNGPHRTVCPRCFDRGASVLSTLPAKTHRYSDFVDQSVIARARAQAEQMSVQECFEFEQSGLALGRQTWSSVFRFLGKGSLQSEPPEFAVPTVRRFAAGAIVAAHVAERVLESLRPDCVVTHHGFYVPQGVLGEVARRDGVRLVTWGAAYRNNSFIYSHDNTYHYTFIDEPVSNWDHPLAEDEERRLMDYLAARQRGRGDWEWITPDGGIRSAWQERDELIGALDLDTSRPIYGLLTNVAWDAHLYYEGQAFNSMHDWLGMTLDFFAANPAMQLIVRIHPHEVRRGNRESVDTWIRSNYPDLPSNITIVSPESRLNTYALMSVCDSVLIYGTKTGVELAPLGIPVIPCGAAWIRGKGITRDVVARDQYLKLLRNLPTLERRLDDDSTARARRYAYHYFFRRMIPVRSIAPEGELPPRFTIKNLAEILPGKDPGLDTICEGILTGKEFIYEPERSRVPV